MHTAVVVVQQRTSIPRKEKPMRPKWMLIINKLLITFSGRIMLQEEWRMTRLINTDSSWRRQRGF
jgi:hypothetical protein